MLFKGKLVVLVAAACVTGVCSAGISGSGKADPYPQGISGSGKAAQPACLILAPFIQPFCFV